MASGPIETVLQALAAARVRYVVVGGVALVLHGHPRFTADLDLVVALDRDNVLAALRALGRLGYRPRIPVPPEAFADPLQRERWAREKQLRVFSLWSETLRGTDVDLFVEEPLPFNELEAQAARVQLESVVAPVASLQHLIQMKEAAGRPLDLEDLRILRRLAQGERAPHDR